MPRVIEVPGWKRPRGYSNGVAACGEILFIAGQVGWDGAERMVSEEFVPQFAQALENVRAVLDAAGGSPEHLVRVTVYVTDKDEYEREAARVGQEWRRILGRIYPAMTLVEVSRLLEKGALVEIEATAVLPERRLRARPSGGSAQAPRRAAATARAAPAAAGSPRPPAPG